MNDHSRIRVLYIDDEVNNLAAFQASFRRNYRIFTAPSAAEGMAILNEETIHVIIADQRMPNSTGIEFFNIIRHSHPDPVRILLTGYTDAESIIDAINKGEIYRYIKKPWDEFEIRNAISNAYEIYTTRMELKHKIEELEKKNDELNRFVYSTSHDLRSPLASIMGVINLARMENSIIDPNGYVGMIESCVNRVDIFIQKIIEYYKGIRIEDEIAHVDFRQLISESIDLCRMQNPDIRFQVNVSQSCEFMGDNFRLAVIFNNLVSNAVKYQKPAEPNPTVSMSVEVHPDAAEIVIEDNGIGILEQHLNQIFTMFFRSTKTVTGLGIGLYIVKEALARVGGEISVKSTLGVGSRFRITVPNRAPRLPMAAAS